MTQLTCRAACRRLQAYYDQELSVEDQIAVGAHLEWCDRCAEALRDMALVGALMRATSSGAAAMSRDESASFQSAVVGRVKAEREVSFVARVRDMFEDMHLVYAGLGAAAAAIVCVVIMLGMMRFATIERPDSLAAIVNFLATPGSNENPVAVDARVVMPRALDDPFSAVGNRAEAVGSGAEEDAVFTLAAVVTREGRIENLEVLHGNRRRQGPDDARLVEGLLDAVARARFEPARVAGLPVAVNMVWMFAHTTVRGSKHAPFEPPVVPTTKKRAASLAVAALALAG